MAYGSSAEIHIKLPLRLHFSRLQSKYMVNYENNQQDALSRLIYYSKSALHVSGDVFVYQQEHYQQEHNIPCKM